MRSRIRGFALLTVLEWSASPLAASFSGATALEYAAKAAAIGPRYPGSAGHREIQGCIRAELKKLGCDVHEDVFVADTPLGPIRMANLITRFGGRSGRAVVYSGHYDTKYLPGIRFVGANDGGSSTGLLLELARVLVGKPRVHDVYLVWFDGEEALGEWSEKDGLHGSRHLAARWKKDGTLAKVLALVNVDMTGDRDLRMLREYYSTPSLAGMIRDAADQLGYGRHFSGPPGAVEDDHVPFLRLGVPAADLIDFDYGPGNRYWHTEEDTIDKLSADSLRVVGEVLLKVLKALESQPPR